VPMPPEEAESEDIEKALDEAVEADEAETGDVEAPRTGETGRVDVPRAEEDEVMHEISHLAEDSERSVQDIAQELRNNGTYSMLEEEISRQKALDFLVENAVPVPVPEDEVVEGDEELAEDEEPVEEPVEARAGVTENDEREEQQ